MKRWQRIADAVDRAIGPACVIGIAVREAVRPLSEAVLWLCFAAIGLIVVAHLLRTF